jgi:subtilisin family serine protease
MTPMRWRLVLFGVFLFLAAANPSFAAQGRAIPGELIVRYRSDVSESQRAQIRGRLPGVQKLHEFSFIRAEHVRFGGGMSLEQAIARLRSDPRVEIAEPNYELHADAIPNDPRFAEQWGLRNTGQEGGTPGVDIDATLAWDVLTGDSTMLVGVIDTGIDYTHPDLVANMWTNPGEIPGNGIDDDHNGYIDDVHGYDFVNNDGDPMDDQGHGTHCAGTIAARGGNGIGVTGINWRLKLVAIKFLGTNGLGSTVGAIQSIDYARKLGVRVTNNSWGGGEYSQTLLEAIEAVGAAGQLFVASAGNTSTDTDVTPVYPGAYDPACIITVANTNHSDGLGDFTNYGLTTVDLGAPGSRILSTQMGGGYFYQSGTSMAAPYVAGACALVWARFPNASNLGIKQIVLNTVDPIPALAGKCVTGGRLNLFRAIEETDSLPPGGVVDLVASNPGSTTMDLTWTATGDDGGTGRASRYDIRYSTSPIDAGNFSAATKIAGPDPQIAGAVEHWEANGLGYGTTYYFALRVLDEYGNQSPLSSVATATTLAAPALQVSPTSLAKTLVSGGNASQTLTVTNTGQGRLDFTTPTPELLLAESGFVQPATIYPAMALAPGATDPSPGVLGNGGPDAFGYRWVDSDQAGGPTFSWMDITTIGSLLPLSGEDANAGPIDLGFAFPFYGNAFTSVRIQTNGALSFDDPTAPNTNVPLPSPGGMTNMIAPFWDDQNFGVIPRVYTYSDGKRFIVEWTAVPNHTAGGGPYTYQAILYSNGEIRFQYLSMQGSTGSETIGIQNATKTVGLFVEYNAIYVHDNLAIRIVPLHEWLSVTPTSGHLLAGNSTDLTVHFDALGMTAGTFAGEIRLDNNSPDTAVTVPATLTVTGTPNLVAPDTTQFGARLAGGTYVRTITLMNDGTDTLRVTGMISFNPSVVPSPTTLTVAPHMPATVVLTWHPTGVATLNTTIAIASNDPDSPNTAKHVTGNSLPAPGISLEPRNAEFTLYTDADTVVQLRVSNTGASPLTFTAQSILPSSSQANARRGDPAPAKASPSASTPNMAGGPDTFGYRWSDSAAPGGPTFAWVEISETGTIIPIGGDDVSAGPYPIGFEFPFYGSPFTSFRFSSNGWISFTSSSTNHTNTSLPNNGIAVPENLIAAFWDDFTFLPGATAYYQYDGTRLIVEFNNVARVAQMNAPNTFEILLYPDGRIVTQYLSMTANNLGSGTIGIQNEARNDGLQVVFNQAYVSESLAIQFSPPDPWLSATPRAGTIPPGGHTDLDVHIDATNVLSGDYEMHLRFDSNDPVLPVHEWPALLHVLPIPNLATPASVAFDTTFLGHTRNRSVTVRNTGEVDLVIESISVDNSLYSTTGGSMTLAPGDSSVLTVTFSPVDAGAYPASLTIESNDPDSPIHVTPLSGIGAPAPRANPTVFSLDATVTAGSSTGTSFNLENLGGSNLYWTASVAMNPVVTPPWLSATPLLGTVVPLGHNTIQIGYDAAQLSPGTYHGLVTIASNDPVLIAIGIPVTLHVNAVVGVEDGLPARYGIKLASGNPVRGRAMIELALPIGGLVDVGVYDVRGALVARLANGELPAGIHALRWETQGGAGGSPSPGVYFLRARTAGGEFHRRFVYLK